MFNIIKYIPLILALPALLFFWAWSSFTGEEETASTGDVTAETNSNNANPIDKANTLISSTQQQALAIPHHTVKSAQINTPVIVGGNIIPARTVTLNAQANGTIKYLGGREGDAFNAGVLLIDISADDQLARRQELVAQLQNAQTVINNAQMQYQREVISPQSQSLSRSGGMGLPMMFDQMFTRPFSNVMPNNIGGDTVMDRSADLFNMSTKLQQAQNQYRQVQAQINGIDARIADSRINTPFAGVILNKLIEVGDTVQIGTPLLSYANLNQLQLEAQVPASIVSRLSPNMILPVRLDGSKYQINARVEQVFPMANSQRRTVTVKLNMPNNSGAIPGMYAELVLPGEESNPRPTAVIPLSAVAFNGSLPAVKVLTDDNQTQLRMVRLGEHMAGQQVVVISGLQPGERIMKQP